MLHEVWKIKNGNSFENYNIYKCDKCEKVIEESFPHCKNCLGYEHLCIDCSFKLDAITEQQYLRILGISFKNAHARVNELGEIETWQGGSSVPPSERNNSEIRASARYSTWREEVYRRDDYTCQFCKARGGKLNAHHIMSFAKFPALRFEEGNGITLCEKCHVKVHQRSDASGKKKND